MDNSSSHVFIATIGNLSENKNENSLRLSLENLFTKWLRIQITTNDININSSQGKKAAIIHLRSLEAAQCVQHNLATLNSRRKLGFKFLQIVDPYVDIIVDVKHVKQESNVQHVKQESNVQHVKQESNVQHDICYVLGEKIGSESRNREFKRGGGNYAYDHLKKDVGVYVCAFLNSEEEGTLFIGVNDEGIVEGIECDHRTEDIIRKDSIDPGIKAIKPDMFPENYTVKFTHVCHKNKRQIGNLKVIEITVKKVEQLTQLYEVFNGDVYIRRDGSKQGPLTVNQIQEWHNQKNKRFMQQRLKSAKTRGERETGQLVARLEEKDQRIGEKEDRIKEKDDRIKEKEDRIEEKDEKIKEKEEIIHSLEKQNNDLARAKSRLGHRIDDTEKEMEEEKKVLEQKLEEEKKILQQKLEEEKKILQQKLEEEKKIFEQQMKEEQNTLKQKMEEEKKILEQNMEEEKAILRQKIKEEKITSDKKISNLEKREKIFKQHISNLTKAVQKLEEQHNTTTVDKAALEQRITVNEQEKIELARRAEELENEKMTLEHQIEDTKKEVEKSKNMSNGVDEERKMLEQRVEDMYLKMKQLEENIDTTEEEKSSLQQKNDEMRLENKSKEEKIKNVEKEEKKLKDKILAEENERKTIEKETEEHKRKLEGKILEMEQEKKLLEEQTSKVKDMKEESSQMENKPDIIPTKLEKKKNEKSSKTCVIS